MASSRIGWVDHGRGIAIILVVYGHCFRGLHTAGYVADGSPLLMIDYVIYCFHMPVFFFLSGLFSEAASQRSARSFWLGRMLAILRPYCIWMTLELILLHLTSGITNAGAVAFGPKTYLYRPVAPFWFLYALLFCNLFTRVFARLGRVPAVALAGLVFLGSQAVDSEIVRLTGWGILYFTVGSASARAVRSAVVNRLIASPWVLAADFCATVGAALLAHRVGISYVSAVPAAMLGILATACMAGQLSRLDSRFPALRIVSALGRISLTVLVVHVLGTAATRIVLVRLFGSHDVPLQLLSGTLVGLSAAIAVQEVSMRLGITSILGLPRVTMRLLMRSASFIDD